MSALAFLGAILAGSLVGWLAPPAVGLLLAVGGALVAFAAVVERHLRIARAPRPVVPPPVRSFDSAFVCTKCAEYTPAPDWEALLRGVAGTADRGPPPFATPTRSTLGAVAIDWTGPWLAPTPAPPSEAELLLRSSLDRWIDAEAMGLVARGGSGSSSSEALSAATEFVARCAACREQLPETQTAAQCADCARPICDPCRPRTVEVDGSTRCLPCAVTQLGLQYLAELEPGADAIAPPVAELAPTL